MISLQTKIDPGINPAKLPERVAGVSLAAVEILNAALG